MIRSWKGFALPPLGIHPTLAVVAMGECEAHSPMLLVYFAPNLSRTLRAAARWPLAILDKLSAQRKADQKPIDFYLHKTYPTTQFHLILWGRFGNSSNRPVILMCATNEKRVGINSKLIKNGSELSRVLGYP